MINSDVFATILLARPAACVVAAAAIAGALSSQSYADELTFKEIVDRLPGVWEADPTEVSEDDRGTFRCEENPLRIGIEQTSEGLLYRSDAVDFDDEPSVSLIREGENSILIQYENEERRTFEGDLVEWYLFMPDVNHFYWVRADWFDSAPVGRTAMRSRCVEAPVS